MESQFRGSVRLAQPLEAKRILATFCVSAISQACNYRPIFVQVGANDGKLADPLYQHIVNGNWSGIMVEPHPVYFKDLKNLHAEQKNIHFENSAIGASPGKMKLFHLTEDQRWFFPEWARGCASLKAHRIQEVLVGRRRDKLDFSVERDISSVTVSIKRLDTVLSDTNVSKVDFLIVDVEGFELDVLSSVDLSTLGLRAAMVECNGSDTGNEGLVAGMLEEAGLVTFRMMDDLFGLHPEKCPVQLVDVLKLLEQTEVAPKNKNKYLRRFFCVNNTKVRFWRNARPETR